MADDQIQGRQQQAGARSYKCPNCTADMSFDAGKGKLHCEYCDTSVDLRGEEGKQSIVEYNLEDGMASSASRGLGAAVKTTRCKECGATVSFPETMTSTACDFCGSNQVLEQQENRNLIRPESVVPFQVDGKAAAARFKEWVKGLWFRPSDLKQRASVTEMTGVYVPYWTFDARVDSSWTAEAGYHYYVTEEHTETDEEGNEVTETREVQHTRWEPAWGSRHDVYDDLLVCASKGLPEKLADKLSTFDTRALQPYDPAFLAGWKAEEYALDLNGAWKRAVTSMEATQESRCSGDVPGDTHRFLYVTNRFSDETFKHVLLPVWLSAFRYGDKAFRFLVNGQTGEVVGRAPWSVIKIVLFIASLVAAAVLAYVLYVTFKQS
jgi:DNA-directed RNA polymerase subunit RPC12/RpoP